MTTLLDQVHLSVAIWGCLLALCACDGEDGGIVGDSCETAACPPGTVVEAWGSGWCGGGRRPATVRTS